MLKVNGDPLDWRDGMTVQDILDVRKYKFPMLIVTIDGEHVSKEMYSSAKVPDGANVNVIHMLSGG
ncbi:MAG: sulfur carrier protein ThiS [Holophagales bacterium]|jgi:sulfur carrier protein|nr:sulfur carrier protein ThiS [Holophagales bacterium]